MNEIEAMRLLVKAIEETLSSPNEVDANFEPANVVDGFYAVARAILHLADVVEKKP